MEQQFIEEKTFEKKNSYENGLLAKKKQI